LIASSSGLLGAHELLAGDDGAVAGNAQVAHAVHLLGQGFLAQQGAVALHQHQARLHGVEVHLDAAFGLGANPAVGHHQGFAVGHPRHLMRAEAMGGDLAGVHQPLAFEPVHRARHGRDRWCRSRWRTASRRLVNHRVAVEVPVRLRCHGLQQAPSRRSIR
jgi:hypothetical protein